MKNHIKTYQMNLMPLFKLLSLTVMILTLGSCGETDKSQVTKYLLLDSRIIEEVTNAKLEVGTVVKHAANPLFEEEKEWEMRFDNLYGNVIFDDEQEIYRCWYSPFIVDSSSTGMTIEERSRRYRTPKNREMAICYATSKDGISWEKPELGLVEYKGSKQNNIVWRGPHGAGLFKDLQEEDPGKRYKVIFRGLSVSFSADGIHWEEETEVNGVDVAGDTHNNAFWAPTLNKYVGITRTWGPDFGREVARIESDDFINWTKEEVVMHGTEKDLQTYAMPVFYYEGVYLGLVAIHQQSTDRVWTELTWSPDTKTWHRIDAGNPLIPCSENELDYDYGCVYPCAYPVFKDDEIQLYYGASDWLHTGWRNGSLALATLRQDGFAGYVPLEGGSAGIILTQSIPYNGKAISLTADVEKGGIVTVSILNDEGVTMGTAVVKNTVTDEELEFDSKIKPGNIHLKIEIARAKVYAFSLQ
jgi:hypothetical protein